MKEITLTLFASASQQGRDFAQRLQASLASDLPREMKVEMRPAVYGGDQSAMIRFGMEDDIVVFDGSVEDPLGSNYQAAQMWPTCMDHFLVVSRTPLPLNFQPFHDGGFPDVSAAPSGVHTRLENNVLVDWVLRQLRLLANRLPRPAGEKVVIREGELGQSMGLVTAWANRRIEEALEQKKARQTWSGRAFVSYLSRHSRNHRHPVGVAGFYVEDVVEQVKADHHDPDFPVLYYPPGALSGEFMTEHRRWQILAFIDGKIRAAEEFWIFETDDYRTSWWTLAELACLAYMNHGGTPLPRIVRCSVQGRELVATEAGPGFVQVLDKAQEREFGRYLSNSDSNTMGYETIRRQQELRERSLPVQWLNYKATQLLIGAVASQGGFPRELLEGDGVAQSPLRSFAAYCAMLQSRVFSPEFLEDRIVACPNCSRARLEGKPAFEEFLDHRLPGHVRISGDEFA
ncbi:hypothetical protein, partial [Longimicrobium sp.]|uniref:hypothetical protein n=1 Tax=Longimicrobium sp. TaxID=2029185 RepID=UPI002F934B73